uniref:40S ribosomal protein S30 n=1 Tax=Salvator merianae TaxID=96440 RepID=A0A8D0BXE6_SALMN
VQLFIHAQNLHTLVTNQETVYGVTDLATLEVAAHMLGGKVHGSLAQAGKVRGQTPKAARQEYIINKAILRLVFGKKKREREIDNKEQAISGGTFVQQI